MSDPSHKARRRLFILFKIIFSCLLIGALIYRFSGQQQWQQLTSELTSLRLEWVGIAIMLHFTAVWIGTFRWRQLLKTQHLPLSFDWLLQSFLIGRFIGAFTPSTTGLDGWRIYDVKQQTGETGASAKVIALEKLTALVAMALMCGLLLPLGGLALLGTNALWLALSLCACALVGLTVLTQPIFATHLTRWVPGPLRSVTQRLLCVITRNPIRPRDTLEAVLFGFASHMTLSAVFVATGYAIGIEVSIGTLLMMGNAIILATLLPVSIGGVGVRESVAVVILSHAGISGGSAILCAFLGYLTGQLPALFGGLLWLSRNMLARSHQGERSAIFTGSYALTTRTEMKSIS